MERKFIDNAGVPIELLTWNVEPASLAPPVVLVPGMLGDAASWAEDAAFVAALQATGPRDVLAVSLRGRGASGCPESGWTLKHHASDLVAVLDAERIERAYFFGWSVGGAYCLGVAAYHPSRALGVVVGDYYPFLPQFSDAWRTKAEELRSELTFDQNLPARIVHESERELLSDPLRRGSVPILVLRGTTDDALLATDRAAATWEGIPFSRVVPIPAGHDVFTNVDGQRLCVEFLTGGGTLPERRDDMYTP